MKRKVIKLKESDLRIIIDKVLKEQYDNTGVPPFPKPNKSLKEVGDVNHGNDGGLQLGPPPPVAKAKQAVKINLLRAKQSLSMLKNLSGVNTDMCDDIDKVIEKFENLYGQPKEKIPEERK